MNDLDTAIAIVGMGGRFPGAEDIDAFWSMVAEGRTGFRPAAAAPGDASATHHVALTAELEGHALFDAGFFGFSAHQADLMDPQHRIFLETAWHAMEDAGCDPDDRALSVGVFAGCGPNRYLLRNLRALNDTDVLLDAYNLNIASDKDFLATRLSYKLNLTGPSLTVQTACSTSLVAVHLACQSLNTLECDLAVAGGVSVQIPHGRGYDWQEGGIMSPTGLCRPFDAAADGTMPGSGVGVVCLQRLADARAQRRQIYAIITGSAINNDGAAKVGYAAPSQAAQAEVIALAHAHHDLAEVDLIEAHGTGTILGDAIELAALTQAFAGSRTRPCILASVKPNVGHLDAASGVTGLIKAALCLREKSLPPTPNFETPNPAMAGSGLFEVKTALTAWEPASGIRKAGVSSFGVGGSNAHVALEEDAGAARAPDPFPGAARAFPLSARTPESLARIKSQLAERLLAGPSLRLDDLAFTLQSGRKSFRYRDVMIASSVTELVGQLKAFADRFVDASAAPASGEVPPGGGAAPIKAREALGWQVGGTPDWSPDTLTDARVCRLPAYPFDSQHHWIEAPARQSSDVGGAGAGPRNWAYAPAWRRAAPPAAREASGGCCLIVTDDQDFGDRAARRLLLRHGTIAAVLVTGPRFKAISENRFMADVADPQQLQRVQEAMTRSRLKPDSIIHCRRPLPGSDARETFWRAQESGFLSVIGLLRWLATWQAPIRSAVLVTCDASGAPADRAIDAGAATLAPLARVLEQEAPGLRCAVVDVPADLFDRRSPDKATYIDWIVEETPADDEPQAVAYRNGQRLVRRLERLNDLRSVEGRGLKEGGAYLITGGLGRIGLRLAAYLARRYKARLALLGRSALPPRSQWAEAQAAPNTPDPLRNRLTALLSIEAEGGQLLVGQGDVSDPISVSQLVREAQSAFGRLDGVFHLAADLSDAAAVAPLTSTTRGSLHAQVAPKLFGLQALAGALGDADLDFGVVFSSNAAVLGGTGFGAYAAANTAATSEVARMQLGGARGWRAIAWDGWGEPTAWNVAPISFEDGFSALEAILEGGDHPEVLVSSRGFRGRVASADAMAGRPAERPAKRPQLGTAYLAPRTQLERDMVAAWEEALGFEGVGVNDDIFELGGDSLAAMTILAIVRDEFGAEIPLRDFLESHRTIVQLSQALVTCLAADA